MVMKVLGTFPLEEIFDNIFWEEDPNCKTQWEKEYCGYKVHMDSRRYQLFKLKGVKCVSCGVEGKYFKLELPNKLHRPHFNLYAVDNEGKEVLMTKDHIIPASKHGNNGLSNLQTMCSICNTNKGNKVI